VGGHAQRRRMLRAACAHVPRRRLGMRRADTHPQTHAALSTLRARPTHARRAWRMVGTLGVRVQASAMGMRRAPHTRPTAVAWACGARPTHARRRMARAAPCAHAPRRRTGMQRATHTNPLTHGARAHGRALYSKASALVLDLHTSTLSYSWAFKDDLLQLFF